MYYDKIEVWYEINIKRKRKCDIFSDRMRVIILNKNDGAIEIKMTKNMIRSDYYKIKYYYHSI